MTELPDASVHEFGDFELDEGQFVLRHRGAPVELEPKALELLLHFARNPRRVVAKEELVREVWRGKFISDAAITYAVGAVRRALSTAASTTLPGDLVESVRLATVHGRGYRFDATVRCRPAAQEASPTPPHEETPTAAPQTTSGLAETKGSSRLSRRVATLALGALVGVVAVVGLRGASRLSRETASLPPPPPARAVVVLATPQVPEGDVELHLLALSILDSLRARLARVEGLTLLQSEVEENPRARPRLLLRLERYAASDSAHLRALLVEAATEASPRGREVPLEQADLPWIASTRDLEPFLRLRERLAERLVEVLLPAVQLAPGTPGISPSDAEGYRLYLLALDRSEALACDTESFVSLLRDSVARDPGFAPAWEVLGWAEYGLVAYCAGEAEHYRAALDAADRALELAPAWAPAVLLKISVLAETGRWREAWAASERAVAAGADPATLAFARSYLMTYAGRLLRAREELEACLELDPLFLSSRSWAPNALLYAGDIDRYLELLPAPTSPFMRYFRGEALVRQGKLREAKEVLGPAFGENPGDQAARLAEALLQLLEGNRSTAATILRALDDQRQRLGTGDGETSFRIASLLARAGDRQGALAALERAVDQGFACAEGIEGEPAFADLAHEPRLLGAIARARRASAEALAAAGLDSGPSL